jgi:hypothetical protein
MNIFISHAINKKQTDLFIKINNYYNNNNYINIIDNTNIKNIENSNLFIMIVDPIYNNWLDTIVIDNNIFIQYGYALHALNIDNVCLFLKNDNQIIKDYNNIKPVFLNSIKYKLYNTETEIINYIDEKYVLFNTLYTNEYLASIIQDKNCISIIKYELSNKLLDNEYSMEDKIQCIDNIIYKYTCNEIIDTIILFIIYESEINPENTLLDYFCHFINNYVINSLWLDNINNQIIILTILNNYYKLFETEIDDINKRNIVILLFKLLNYSSFYNKKNIKIIIDNILINYNSNNYINFINNLNGLYGNIYSNLVELKNKEYYINEIINSKNIYNKYEI